MADVRDALPDLARRAAREVETGYQVGRSDEEIARRFERFQRLWDAALARKAADA